ncbi:MAG TPA: maleylpyruvate isomerase family mycothiol-dependent enzyme [Micromonosporaceae bacterium]|nr:maleylpyruvate isomerase family mycothiol-dependent enzyme [Micromonosporaceae bacterium]
MEPTRFLECLAVDQSRLREAVAGYLTAAVPTCPGWTVADLAEHVALVFLHKVESMRRGGTSEPSWPPDVSGEEPLALLDKAYDTLVAEFAARDVTDGPAGTWYEHDQTVGFWIRRMAHETVIHRVDAELAAGQPVAAIPDDLALDGIDEVLLLFLSYQSRKWHDYFAERLPATAETVLVTAGGRGWLVRLDAEGVSVEPAPTTTDAQATVAGTPQQVLLWLWRRAADDSVQRSGDEAVLGRLRQLLETATQ